MSHSRRRLHGLYPVTSAALCADEAVLRRGVEAALRGGATLMQYRDKLASIDQRATRARMLIEVCAARGAKLIVNDDVELAASIGAHGVHLGAADPPLSAARSRLGPDAILGASCGPDPKRALSAIGLGADYVAFGRFFPSRTKPGAPQAAIESLVEARRLLTVPICVIGGVTPDNAAPLIEAGADLVAAVEGVFESLDPLAIEAAARRYASLF